MRAAVLGVLDPPSRRCSRALQVSSVLRSVTVQLRDSGCGILVR